MICFDGSGLVPVEQWANAVIIPGDESIKGHGKLG